VLHQSEDKKSLEVNYLDRLINRPDPPDIPTSTPSTTLQNPQNRVLKVLRGSHRRVSGEIPSQIAEQRLGDDDVVPDRDPELALVALQPRPRLACCAVHAASKQTPDGRWWCWRAVATVTLPDPDPSPALQCRRMANLWAEYMRQGLEVARWRFLKATPTRVWRPHRQMEQEQ
jgi:hypothetical protein